MESARSSLVVSCLVVGALAMAMHFGPAVKIPTVIPDVAPVTVLSDVSSADKAQLRLFYQAMADIVVRDGSAKEPAIKGVFDLRNRHKYALSMAFENTGMAGKYPGLGDRIDAYLIKAIGDLDVPLTPEIRQQSAKAFLDLK